MKLRIAVYFAVVSAFFLFSSYTYYDDGGKNEVLLKLMIQGLSYNHYQPQDLDDEFSNHVFDLYLKRLDYNKRFFTQADYNQLAAYRENIDEEVQEGNFAFFETAIQLFDKRKEEAREFYEDLLSRPFDYSLDESFDTDYDNLPFASNRAELKERWRVQLKYQALNRLVDEMEAQAKKEEDKETLSYAEMEEKARERVRKSYDNYFRRLDKLSMNDRRAEFINAIANSYDPHTDYYPPKDKEDFDIHMSGRLEGIGAQLSERDGLITVVTIVPGSASYRQGELKVGDKILKVGQGSSEPVDVVDMPLDEAVKLIRGKKGTQVKLTVRKIDGTQKIIPIVRDVVVLEETYAKSSILTNQENGERIGYIHLPQFYADFQNPRGRRCARDVREEISKLKAEGIDGLILDLRNNGGGSLSDVVDMAGLFIENGPIVQVKSRGNSPQILSDNDSRVQYDGPLVVMVNEFSASASEILAAAIQDYERGIVVGSPSTFGKGTVQRFVNLDDYLRGYNEIKPLGSLKITFQKFYRINGDATQHKGVTADIILPDQYSLLEMGEKDQEYSLEWDAIDPVDYQTWGQPVSNLPQLSRKSAQRMAKSPTFEKIRENAQRLKRNNDQKSYSLNIDQFRAEQKKREEESQAFQDLIKPIEAMEISSTVADLTRMETDTIFRNRMTSWHKELKEDPYVFEVVNIIGDMNF